MTATIAPRRTWDVRAAVLAGINAGLVFVLLEMILMPLFLLGDSLWAPPRMIAAIALGDDESKRPSRQNDQVKG